MKTKKTLIAAAALLAAIGLQATSITIDTAHVGDANNPADTILSSGAYRGSISYEYNIGTTEVTAGQYAAFLNAVASTGDTYGLYNANMYNLSHGCGIQKVDNGNGTYSYVATKGDKLPVNYVSFYDAARFCNWLTTGNTETGVYMLNGASSLSLIQRDTTAWANGGVAVANLDEWYKAAFYQGNGTYSAYANGTNTAPTSSEANYNNYIGTITNGDFGVASHYGTYGQNGSVWEWTDTVTGTNVHLRGGDFDGPAEYLASSFNNSSFGPTNESNDVGFRVVSLQPIPEPGTYAAIFGALALALAAYRRRK